MASEHEAPARTGENGFLSARSLRHLLILLGLGCFLWVPRLRGPIDLRWDAGVYYILGTSLAEGKGYRLLNEPGEIEAIQYPPLLPFVVAAHQWALGSHDPLVVAPWLRFTYFAIFLVYLCAIYRMAVPPLGPGLALLASMVSALQMQSLFLSNLLFAEIPFALASTLFVLASRKPEKPGRLILATLLVWSTYLLRTAGVALMAAWIAESLFRKRWKGTALRVVLSLVPILGWQAYVSHVKSTDEYRQPAYPYQREDYQYYNVGYMENLLLVDPFVPERGKATLADMGWRIVTNAARLPLSLSEGVSAARGFWQRPPEGKRQMLPFLEIPPRIVSVFLAFFAILMGAGLLLLLLEREWLVPLYTLASLAMISLTPWPGQFSRYLAPITPFLALLLFRGLAGWRRYAGRTFEGGLKVGALLPVYLVAFLIPSIQYYTVLGVALTRLTTAKDQYRTGEPVESRLFYHDRTWRGFDKALEWLKAWAPNDAIVASSAPHLVFLKTGLRAVFPPFEPDPAKARSLLDSVPVEYLIVDTLEFVDISRRYGLPAVAGPAPGGATDSGGWDLVYSDPDNRKLAIFERSHRSAGEGAPDPSAGRPR